MLRLIRPKLLPSSSSLRRNISHDTTRFLPHDTSRPFPPPQPTRPIDILEQSKDKSVMSPALDAMAKDISHNSAFRQTALSELRTEIQVLRKNDMQMLQAELSLLIREVDILDQRLNEGISTMKNDIQMDMNNRKNETREDQKAMDMKIQEINNKFTIRLGDIRTEIEAVRWETIWKGMAGLTIATLGYLLTRYSARKADRLRSEEERKRKRLQEEANRAGTLDMEVIY
ncbi:hypothetical protein CU098_007653 [Rhizopus stolonifer]|uniref:Uncharacterized protein n=1 Tax=Rhizopus stolonifer TaxID=4846 RepID=A0A367KHW6_RHIST|nr:hypothetical protein CU098_007653 [Rhizopus stolonifer]